MENTIKHPTKSDYIRIKDFTDSIVRINSSIAKFNNHLEVLKRVGDCSTLCILASRISVFVNDIIDSYFETLKNDNDEDKE